MQKMKLKIGPQIPDKPGTMKPVEFRVLVMAQDGSFVAQCLEHDIAAQGRTAKQMIDSLLRMVVGHAVLAEKRGAVPFANLPPAPKAFEEQYERGVFFQKVALPGHPTAKPTAKKARKTPASGQLVLALA